MKFRSLRLSMALSAVIAATPMLIAAPSVSVARDEGMWTFDNFPLQTVNEKWDLSLDQAWLDRVRMAAVRIQGCSASFVSPEGLILTNHHCVVGCLQELSSAETDYVKNGFMVGTREEELRCPGQTAEVLTEIVDVTDRMLTAGMGMEGQAFAQARQGEVARIAQENCAGDPKFNCQVVDFYRGGRFALYKYRRYEDVRIAFAPEFQAAFFGGDPDNFNFPRYALDASFLRAYEDGKPVATPNHLKWNANAPAEGDPTFVVGNPGSTSRLLTMSQLERLRDQQLPITLIQASELRGRFLTYAASGEEAKRVSVDPIFGLENSFKAQYGQHQALLDPAFMATKRQEEARLRAAVEADPALKQRIGDPWAELEAIQGVARDLYLPYRQLAASAGGGSQLYAYARAIGRAAAQNAAGSLSADRKAQLEAALGAETPIYIDMEEIRLGYWLSKTREYLTVDHPQVKALLGKESPEGLADRVIGGTKLADPAFRVAALSMTPEELAAADPLIAWVMANDAAAQAVASEWNQKVTIPTAQAAERVAQARFAVLGTGIYPDATFTLRISYGEVKGWSYRGVDVPAFTRIGGLYERHTGAEPFNAAAGFLAAEGRINKDVVFDFTSTNDIIGGNSGSPVINARGEVIGAAFDGNIHSLGGAFGYDGTLNRTVSVSTAAITESLRVVYPQPRLLRELGVHG
ncbi:MAG: S46 family peptidase [Alphaproteobacteria bacterium]|nr:S46 family peptidase [Alphaproteobacteria bacterium]MBU1527144.1 S46 family peptidase [Alphaproteobacteria bacterium]MBU2116617.1 S46 family peptidase [Alphaproteobacteria bacterium]MBU2350660.1 S46 family peptidase [Alphaproteobacteria bacterium]MBU2383277.1 S46 family peptidase [Alphaproteobacteria bacterium]